MRKAGVNPRALWFQWLRSSCFVLWPLWPSSGLWSTTFITESMISTSAICTVCVPAPLCPTLFDLMDYSLLGSSIHGIFQSKILEWVAITYSRGSSWPRDWTHVSCASCIGRQVLYHCSTWEAPSVCADKDVNWWCEGAWCQAGLGCSGYLVKAKAKAFVISCCCCC